MNEAFSASTRQEGVHRGLDPDHRADRENKLKVSKVAATGVMKKVKRKGRRIARAGINEPVLRCEPMTRKQLVHAIHALLHEASIPHKHIVDDDISNNMWVPPECMENRDGQI